MQSCSLFFLLEFSHFRFLRLPHERYVLVREIKRLEEFSPPLMIAQTAERKEGFIQQRWQAKWKQWVKSSLASKEVGVTCDCDLAVARRRGLGADKLVYLADKKHAIGERNLLS